MNVVKLLYNEASSVVCVDGWFGEWFYTHSGVRQGFLLSPTLFSVFLKWLISELLEDLVGTVSTDGNIIKNMRFTNNIDGLASSEEELKTLIEHITRMAKSYGMKINSDKTKVMMNSTEGIGGNIKVNNTCIEVVN